MNIPDNAVIYILYQRTSYLALLKNRIVARLLSLAPNIIYRTILKYGSRLQKVKIKQAFADEMEAEYRAIKPWLPQAAGSILDIGCGIGGIDVLLYRHYRSARPIKFYMLDKTSLNARIYYGYKSKGAFYNSLEITQKLLEENGVSPEDIHLIEATPDYQIRGDFQADLVVSLISWGFHYPVATYLHPVYAHMARGARLILDVRKGTDGERDLRQVFSDVQPLSETRTTWRLLIKKV